MASCNHITAEALEAINPNIYYERIEIRKTSFYIYENNKIIIIRCECDICPTCNKKYSYYFIADDDNLYVLRDDLQKMQTNVYNFDIKHFAAINVISAPRFGTFIRHESETKGSFIIYCTNSKIEATGGSLSTCLIDGVLSVCGITKTNEIVLINANGEIIKDAIVIYSEPDNEYLYKLNIYGEIFRVKDGCCNYKWIYNNPSPNTKPAVLAAEADD
jgi:hypothetical protein